MTEKELNEIAFEMIDVMVEHDVSAQEAEKIIKTILPANYQSIKSITCFRKDRQNAIDL